MSKKSSIFASDFNSGIRNNLKYQRVMEKVCVFKCNVSGKWFRVYECAHPDDSRRTCYQTYIGRKRLDSSTWSNLGSAIGSILDTVGYDVVSNLVEAWR